MCGNIDAKNEGAQRRCTEKERNGKRRQNKGIEGIKKLPAKGRKASRTLHKRRALHNEDVLARMVRGRAMASRKPM